MRRVGIVGAGITPCRSHWLERTYYGLSQMAVKTCLEDAGVSVADVDAVIYGIYNDIFELSAIPEHPLQGIIGMTNKPGMRVTNGGATGAYAMLAAYTFIASGLYDTVLALANGLDDIDGRPGEGASSGRRRRPLVVPPLRAAGCSLPWLRELHHLEAVEGQA